MPRCKCQARGVGGKLRRASPDVTQIHLLCTRKLARLCQLKLRLGAQPIAPARHTIAGLAGVIAVVVFGLYGNSTSHFELASSRHMRDSGGCICETTVGAAACASGMLSLTLSACMLTGAWGAAVCTAAPRAARTACLPRHVQGCGRMRDICEHVWPGNIAPVSTPVPLPWRTWVAAAVQGTLSFALNGMVFFFAGASAVNFMIRRGGEGVLGGGGQLVAGSTSCCSGLRCRRCCCCVHACGGQCEHAHRMSASSPLPSTLRCRAVEGLGDYGFAFALFPAIYLALFLIR